MKFAFWSFCRPGARGFRSLAPAPSGSSSPLSACRRYASRSDPCLSAGIQIRAKRIQSNTTEIFSKPLFDSFNFRFGLLQFFLCFIIIYYCINIIHFFNNTTFQLTNTSTANISVGFPSAIFKTQNCRYRCEFGTMLPSCVTRAIIGGTYLAIHVVGGCPNLASGPLGATFTAAARLILLLRVPSSRARVHELHAPARETRPS